MRERPHFTEWDSKESRKEFPEEYTSSSAKEAAAEEAEEDFEKAYDSESEEDFEEDYEAETEEYTDEELWKYPEEYAEECSEETVRHRASLRPLFLFALTLLLILGSGGGLLIHLKIQKDQASLQRKAAIEEQVRMQEEARLVREARQKAEEEERLRQEAERAENISEVPAILYEGESMDGTYSGSVTGAGGSYYIKEEDLTASQDGGEKCAVLLFAGDILFDAGYAAGQNIQQRGGIENSFDTETLRTMREADIFMVNNEFCYTVNGSPQAEKTYTLHADPSRAAWLKDMGADIVTLANNHVFDYGETGLQETLETLRNEGIPYVGAGENIEEASRTVYVQAGGIRIALIGTTMVEQLDPPDTRGASEQLSGVFRCWDPTLLYQRIREAEEQADFTVVYIHWGVERETVPEWRQEKWASEIEEAGADLIIGAHPHVIQPIDYIADTPVVYSLGNFMFNSNDTESCMVRCTVNCSDGSILKLEYLPLRVNNTYVSSPDGEERQQLLGRFQEMSSGIFLNEDGIIRKAY